MGVVWMRILVALQVTYCLDHEQTTFGQIFFILIQLDLFPHVEPDKLHKFPFNIIAKSSSDEAISLMVLKNVWVGRLPRLGGIASARNGTICRARSARNDHHASVLRAKRKLLWHLRHAC